MGDARCLFNGNARFKPEDFAVYHPGGALGAKIIVARDILEHTLNL
jgi:arabinose-5-phosphate isomerase